MHKRSLLTTAIIGAAVLGFAVSASAAAPSADQDFAKKAASGGLAEVALGQLAQSNGQSQQVKDFGQRMVNDHSSANEQLKAVAQQEGITLPAQPDSKDMAAEQKLKGLKGSAFDSAYTSDMVRDHQQDIADFQKEAQSGQDPALKAFAQKTLPTLQQHLRMAQQIKPSK